VPQYYVSEDEIKRIEQETEQTEGEERQREADETEIKRIEEDTKAKKKPS
jgi:hypothetical protein